MAGVTLHSHAHYKKIQGLPEIKDTHRPRVLQQAYAKEHRNVLGAVRVLNFE